MGLDTVHVSTVVQQIRNTTVVFLKVLHLARTDTRPGAPLAAYRLHSALRDIGVDSSMLVGEKVSGDNTIVGPSKPIMKIINRLSPYIENLPLMFFRSNSTEMHSPGWIGTGQLLKKTIKRYHCDILHLHWVNAGFLSIEDIGRLMGPLVWRLPDMWAFCGAERYAWESERFADGYHRSNRPQHERGFDLNRWAWRRKKKAWGTLNNLTIVTPSKWMASCAERSILFKNKRIEVIPTGIDIALFKPIDKQLARDILGVPRDAKTILFGGVRVDDTRKGGRQLIEALSSLREFLVNNKVVLETFGLGSVTVGADSGIVQYNLNRITDERLMPLVYASADIFVAPSLYDNLPNTVIEAMSCGIPVISCSTGGIPDVLQDGVEGLLVPPDDVGALAKAIKMLIENEPLRRTVSSNARTRIQKELTLSSIAGRYLKLYEDVLKKNSY